MQEDSYRHKGMRQNLVQVLKDKGITDVHVLDAIGIVPRHFFLESMFVEFAYQEIGRASCRERVSLCV